MNTTTSTTRFEIVTLSSSSFYVVDNESGMTVQDRTGNTRYFTSRSSARKAVTRLNRPAGDRHR